VALVEESPGRSGSPVLPLLLPVPVLTPPPTDAELITATTYGCRADKGIAQMTFSSIGKVVVAR